MGRSHKKDWQKRSRSRSLHRVQNDLSTRSQSPDNRKLSETSRRDVKRHHRDREYSTEVHRSDKHERSKDRYVFS